MSVFVFDYFEVCVKVIVFEGVYDCLFLWDYIVLVEIGVF